MYKSKTGYIIRSRNYEHRINAERALGRKLKGTERVHHVDGDKTNNSNNNLVICPNESYHKLLHARQRILELNGDPNADKYCSHHKCLHSRSEFSTKPSSYDGLHNTCRSGTNEYRKEKGLNRSKFNWKTRLDQQYRRIASKYTNRNISWLQKT